MGYSAKRGKVYTLKESLPTSMDCMLQIQILWISWYTKLLIVVTDSCHRLFHRFGFCSNSSGYLLGKKNVIPYFEQLRLLVSLCEKLSFIRTVWAIRLKRLSSVQRKLSSVWTAQAICYQTMSAALLFQTTFTRAICNKPVQKCK